MAHSIIVTDGTAGFGPYPLKFTLGILSRTHVTCRVNEEVDGSNQPVFRNIVWLTDGLVNIGSGTEPTAADTVTFYRTVPVTNLIHDYSDNVPITEENLDESNLQLIMLVHQFLDGRIDSPLVNDLNMGNFKIVNLAPGAAGTDAVNVDQLADALEGVIAGDATGRLKVDAAGSFGYLEEKIIGDGSTIAINQVGDQLVASYTGIIPPIDNTTAIVDPVATNDSSEGYSKGSRWFNMATNEIFICYEADVGAAVWIDITYNTEDILPLLAAKQDIVPRVQAVTSAATVTPTSLNDEVIVTAQAVALAIANPTGTMSQGQVIGFRIKDNGTARAITWDTNYRAIGTILPTTTVINKTLYVWAVWNATDTKFDVQSVTQEA